MRVGNQHDSDSPFHVGEKLVQERMGVRAIEDWAKKVVRPYLPDQHKDFYTALPFLVAAARDDAGQPWATILEGSEGFVEAPDERSLLINALPANGDALEHALKCGGDLGILGIELATRRRNRVNGVIAEANKAGLAFQVGQSFGNCPQYIRERNWRRVEYNTPGAPIVSDQLSQSQQSWIANADTFFIASGYRGEGENATYGMDASHRGGDRGFVRVTSEKRVLFPDYAGNNHFNTIGNLMLDPRAGFLFVDFETGGLLQLTGHVDIDWDSELIEQLPGARRLVILEIEQVVELPSALSLRWDYDAESVRSLRVVEKIKESEDVTSFVFEARDGGPLARYSSGQHLPIELQVDGIEGAVRRTYSLSGPPSADRYRISVKREPKGLASRHLHDNVGPGEIVDSRVPAGDFLIESSERPMVFVSAGVGITPLLSMLYDLAEENSSRPVWFIHGARDGKHHPFANEVRGLARRKQNICLHIRYSRPVEEDKAGKDYDSVGRVDISLLRDLVDRSDAHYYLCGPTAFMAQLQTDLESIGVPANQVHTESFGPTG